VKSYKVKYSGETFTLPMELIRHLSEANAEELKTLILLAVADGKEPELESAGIDEEEYNGAVSFLRGAGLITASSKKKAAVAQTKKEEKNTSEGGKKTENAKTNAAEEKRERKVSVRSSSDLPQFTSKEISDMMRDNAMLASLIDACQQTLGKTFNASECNTVIAMHDALGLDGEYILILLAYCAEREKKSLAYIQRMAIGLVEQGILTPPQLEAEFSRRTALKASEPALRKIFGMGERALTKKETEIFTCWVADRQFSTELIKEAYELTVSKINKPSIPYCNTILEDWHANGITTPEQAKAAATGKKQTTEINRGSFETDDFLSAALSRSFAGVGKKE